MWVLSVYFEGHRTEPLTGLLQRAPKGRPTPRSPASRIHRCPGGLCRGSIARVRPELFPGIGVLPGPATEAVFATAEGITQQLSGPRVKLPPPVLQENGHIDKEYFSVLAAKEGACVTNSPASFPEDHVCKCIVICG